MQCAHDEQRALRSSAKDPKCQLANKYTDSLAVLHKGLVACRDTAWGFFWIDGVN